MSLKSLIIAFIKIAVSGAVIAGVAGIFIVISDDGEVSEAQADVSNFHSSSLNEHGSFGRVLAESGFEPEPYEWNGNLVFFAVGDSDLPPDEFNLAIQERLVRAGINSKIHETNHFSDIDFVNLAPQYETLEEMSGENWVPQQLELNRAQLNGELVPQFSNSRGMQLSGIVPRVTARDTDELHQQLENQVDADGLVDIEQRIAGFRFIDATYDETTGGSHLTAAWADHGFDPKAISEPQASQNMDLELPPCLGCDRTTRFAALQNEPYALNQFTTRSSARSVVDFYTETMPRRGWQSSNASAVMDEVVATMPGMQGPGELVQFQRDGDFISLYVSENPRTQRTSVISVMGQ